MQFYRKFISPYPPHISRPAGLHPDLAPALSGEVFLPIVEHFERYLRYEKYRSEETIRSYISDLCGFLALSDDGELAVLKM